MASPVRRQWEVRGDDPFFEFIAEADEHVAACLQNLITQLRRGQVDLIPAGVMNFYLIFACEVIVTVTVEGDTALLVGVIEDGGPE